MRKHSGLRWAFLAVFLTGAAVRAIDLNRPADGTIRESWREADYAALARNFDREGMDILSPRIDWRGGGPGYAEMEFPFVPWLTASLYRAFGSHEVLGRVVSYVFSLLAFLVFCALARSLLPPSGALFAAAFFALAPLAVRVSNALQPESLMLFLYLTAVLAFRRWLLSGSKAWYAAALAATAGAILIKAPAAHIGLLFILLIIDARGWRALFKPSVMAFSALALLPAAVWIAHAHRFWLLYGNSLGVSNEFHWLGWDLIAQPRLILAALLRLVRIEAVLAATIPGLLLVPFILWTRRREAAAKFQFFWLGAIAVYYILTIRTTGDFWASYYHVVSIAPYALAFGMALAGIEAAARRPGSIRFACVASFVLGTAIIAVRAILGAAMPSLIITTAALIVLAAGAGILLALRSGAPRPSRVAAQALAAVALLALFPLEGAQVARDLHPTRFQALYQSAVSFRTLTPERALILVSGGPRLDETGKPVAYNASYFFYWLDRKGFNLPEEDQTLESVAAFAARGAEFFVLEDDLIKARPGFKEELKRIYPLLADGPAAALFRLRSGVPK
jgi:4-amino-4-deoxy-L-arabinose transferase-like glycosyltransferase